MKTRRFITMGLMSVIAIVGTASMNAQIAEGLIAHWSFDGDLQDPIGDNHGTILNDATIRGRVPVIESYIILNLSESTSKPVLSGSMYLGCLGCFGLLGFLACMRCFAFGCAHGCGLGVT